MHPVKQIYHCFGCGVGGDVFKFIMEVDKVAFLDAVRVVAEKCGIPVPQARERSPEERAHHQNQQRAALVEMHGAAATFFARHLMTTAEGKAGARRILRTAGLNDEAITRFGLGFSPSGGDALLRGLENEIP